MPPAGRIVVGSRSSPLALIQTEEVLAGLRLAFPDVEFAVESMSTGGDDRKEAPLLSMDRGMFVKEIERALLDREIDLAVHSAKDVPTELPDDLAIRAVGVRNDPRDVQVNRWGADLAGLPPGARLGTSSPRRVAQLRAVRPDVELLPIRGNVGTRLEKGRGTDYDGVVLAAAGLHRMGMESDITEYLAAEVCTPDVGQGTLVAEFRSDDPVTPGLLDAVQHGPTVAAFVAERAFLAAVGGGCKTPIAAYATLEGSRLRVAAMAAAPEGERLVRIRIEHDAEEPERAGRLASEALMDAGAAKFLQVE